MILRRKEKQWVMVKEMTCACCLLVSGVLRLRERESMSVS
jgi:hypothetical protein